MTQKRLFILLLLICSCACSSSKVQEPKTLKEPIITEAVIVTEKLPEELPEVEPVITPVEEVEPKEETKAETAKVKKEIETLKDVRLSWKAPNEKLIRYFLEYGYQKNKLSNKKTIEMIELLNIDHPKYGSIFIYTLKNIPSNAKLFYRLQSENGVGLSKKSKILRIP